MNTILKILCRVLRRRMQQGENLEEILSEYSRLSAEEKALVLNEILA